MSNNSNAKLNKAEQRDKAAEFFKMVINRATVKEISLAADTISNKLKLLNVSEDDVVTVLHCLQNNTTKNMQLTTEEANDIYSQLLFDNEFGQAVTTLKKIASENMELEKTRLEIKNHVTQDILTGVGNKILSDMIEVYSGSDADNNKLSYFFGETDNFQIPRGVFKETVHTMKSNPIYLESLLTPTGNTAVII